ncbi:hypothetical protein CDAR_270071 [Caerostris darwini]|uniref:Uncharacterized protein n=1 Tax=Caerostris darwini TaxID=1538125 RepID=A0AAV4RN97_9ARAC|nr:hypothetical protein CDAR_270071 [Caerostris darwini]
MLVVVREKKGGGVPKTTRQKKRVSHFPEIHRKTRTRWDAYASMSEACVFVSKIFSTPDEWGSYFKKKAIALQFRDCCPNPSEANVCLQESVVGI